MPSSSDQKIMEARIEYVVGLEQQIAALVDALKDWRDMFDWGNFTIDFSNGITCNGIDEGTVKGSAILKDMREKTKQALALAEGDKDA